MDIFHALDLFGTAVFAYTGANAGKRHNFHFIGVLYIAALSAVGGGTIRTVLLQTPTLFWMTSPDYMLIVLTVVLYSYLPTGQLNTQKFYFYVLDCFALAVFVSLGFTATLASGQPTHIAFAMGILTGIGGGLIRDAITSQPPQALSDPIYPLFIVVCSVSCLVSEDLGMAGWTIAVPAAMAVVFSTHIYYRLNSKRSYKPPAALRFAGQINPSFYKGARSLGYVGLKALMVLCLLGSTIYFFYANQFSTGSPHHLLSDFTNKQGTGTGTPLHAAKSSFAISPITMPSSVGRTNNSPVDYPTASAYIPGSAHVQESSTIYDTANLQYRVQDKPTVKNASHISNFLIENKYLGTHTQVKPSSGKTTGQRPNNQQVINEREIESELATTEQVIFTVTSSWQEPAATLKNKKSTATDTKQNLKTQTTSLTVAELRYARNQFEVLANAISHKNLAAVEMLTIGGERKNICAALFERYVEIHADITDFSSDENSNTVTAILQLNNMRLPNGNLTLPADSYGRIALNLEYSGDGWSKIQW